MTVVDPFSPDFVPSGILNKPLPTVSAYVPITGNGLVGIRRWLVAVERFYGVEARAVAHYAGVLGYFVNLKTFRIEVSDRGLAQELGWHRSRLNGHRQRLADDGFLVQRPKRRDEQGGQYVLSTPTSVRL